MSDDKITESYFSGYCEAGYFIKNIKEANILRLPVPSFTIDADRYEQLRSSFHRIRIVIKETGSVYELSREQFDLLRREYDYGNGKGYRVPVNMWEKIAVQTPLI